MSSSGGAGVVTTQPYPMQQQQPTGAVAQQGQAGSQMTFPTAGATTINFANCKKVFVQRDYSDGTGVRFQTRFPAELEGRIEKQQFEFTLNMMNTMYAEAERANCSTFCEGCMACLTAYVIYFCSETHYEKCLKKVARFVVEQNEQVWTKRGLLITDPIERGLRVVEISILTEPATPSNQA